MPAFFASPDRKSIVLKAVEQFICLVYFRNTTFKKIPHQMFHPSARIKITIGHESKQGSSGSTPVRLLEGKGEELQAPGKRNPIVGKGMMQVDENGQPQQPDIFSDLIRSKGEPLRVSRTRYHPIGPKMIDIQPITEKG